jgi:hypothetical protein
MEAFAHARAMKWKTSDDLYSVQNALEFVFEVVINGGRYTHIQQTIVMCNIIDPA